MSKFKFRIRYTRMGENGALPCTEDVYGISATSALNVFHRTMQLTKQMSSDRKEVVRPKLYHNEYSITKISQLYNSDATGRGGGEWIESDFDLPPNSKNPNLANKAPKDEVASFGFMDSVQSGRLAE